MYAKCGTVLSALVGDSAGCGAARRPASGRGWLPPSRRGSSRVDQRGEGEQQLGGSAVVERQFPGTPMEMITVYHLDGDEVMLNHCCVLGNQPRLKAAVGDRKNTIKFSFVGATNLTSKDDPHMHEGWLTFVSKDSIKSSWTKFVDGKAAEEHSFELIRKKKQDKTRKDR